MFLGKLNYNLVCCLYSASYDSSYLSGLDVLCEVSATGSLGCKRLPAGGISSPQILTFYEICRRGHFRALLYSDNLFSAGQPWWEACPSLFPSPGGELCGLRRSLGTKGDIAGAHVSKVIPLPLTHEGKMKWAVAEVALGGS